MLIDRDIGKKVFDSSFLFLVLEFLKNITFYQIYSCISIKFLIYENKDKKWNKREFFWNHFESNNYIEAKKPKKVHGFVSAIPTFL